MAKRFHLPLHSLEPAPTRDGGQSGDADVRRTYRHGNGPRPDGYSHSDGVAQRLALGRRSRADRDRQSDAACGEHGDLYRFAGSVNSLPNGLAIRQGDHQRDGFSYRYGYTCGQPDRHGDE